MKIERIEVRLLSLPLVEAFVAAHGTTAAREVVVVRMDTDQGHGWGECAALSEPTYSDEFAAGAFAVLEDEMVPRLVGHDLDAISLHSRLSMIAGHPMAKAALEMALIDVELRTAGQSLAHWLGATRARVAAGVAVGLGRPGAVAERVEQLAAEGFGRVKLKICPGQDTSIVEAVLARTDHLELHVDGNGSFQAEHLDRLANLAAGGVSAVEQPFPVDRPDLAACLAAASPAAVVADEAASSLAAVDRLRLAGALSGVSLKPSRLGGLQAARQLHDACVAWHLPLTAGGMVETGLGRHALAALAALPGFTLTGDVSPARRWLLADPWDDLELIDGFVTVPTGPGVAPDPDLDQLNHFSVKQISIRHR